MHASQQYGTTVDVCSLQELIKLICDVKAMENAVMEMKYDANKAPLGWSLC